ncbi:MAG: cell division topological specificity factor MinE [Anaerolineae bacterium]|nr:cell division topological specificity factor MinE [Anaerolineae bacterium]
MSLFSRLLRRSQPSSRDVAKDRLQLVLVHDRIRIPPSQLAALKEELLAVISRYFDVDRDGVEITFAQSQRASRLVAEVPVFANARGMEKG